MRLVRGIYTRTQLLNIDDLITLIAADSWMMDVLRLTAQLALPDWCICAGFVRSKVWDTLHGFDIPTPLQDVDVVFFDPLHTDEHYEKAQESILRAWRSDIPWSVKNQARMHIHNQDDPYTSTTDALSKFPETPTAVGVTLRDGIPELVAPYGIDDLVQLVVKPTPHYTTHWETKRSTYKQRMASKQWELIWQKLSIVHME